MSGVLQRAVGWFLAPPAVRPQSAAVMPPAARAVVLGSPADAVPLAAAVALSLRAAAGSPAAVVAVWSPDDVARAGSPPAVSPAAATRAASRLAQRLAAHGPEAVARGRLVWLALSAEPQAAAGGVRRASAIVEDPLVTAVTGPRPAELDELVAEHDVVVVAGDPESALARAALARLTDRGIAARACRPLGRGLPRALALAGVAATRLAIGGTLVAAPGDES